MATLIRTLKGRSLKSLVMASRTPGIRNFLGVIIKLRNAKKIKTLAELSGQKEIQAIVVKFTSAEQRAYTKYFVPLGFPKLENIRKMSIRGAVKGTAELTDTHLMEVLEEHIDFLKNETFFQKAHKEAKKQNIIDRSEEARTFYHDYAINYSTGFSYTRMLKEGGTRVSRPLRGKMMFFSYRPDEVTSTYDLYPLIFVLNRGKDYFDGINFHYLVPKMRAVLLGDMFDHLSNLNFDLSTQLNFRQFINAVNTNKKYKFGKQAIRRYNYNNLQSKIINVHPLDWELAIMVETEKFFNENDSRTASQQIWKETRMKASTI